MSAAELTALEAIFSCGICFASYLDIYKHDDKTVNTLNDPGLSLQGTVPKLWMTSCGHVICGRHLEGGAPFCRAPLSSPFVQSPLVSALMITTDDRGYQGAPFHPAGVDMMAACTVCIRDFKKKENVALYPIWGVTDGFYDARLPKAFFKVPPIKFDKIYIEGVGSLGRGEPSRLEHEAIQQAREALRFQFISLICYAKGTRTRLLETERERDELRRRSEHQLKVSKEENARLLVSLHRLDDQREMYRDKLAVLEGEKAAWRQKKRMAIHYLGLVRALADENTILKKRLVSLGQFVEETNYAFDETEINFLSSDHSGSEAVVRPTMDEFGHIIPEDKGKKRVDPGVMDADQIYGIRSFSDPRKRKYLSSRDEISSKVRSVEDLKSIHHQSSRDDMPPPPLPPGRDRAKTTANTSLFTPSRQEDDSPSLDQFLMSVPIATTGQAPDIIMSDQQSDTRMNWPFAGPNQIDATKEQTESSAYFSRPCTNHVFRLELMEWVKNGDESSTLLAQQDPAYTGSGNTNGTDVLPKHPLLTPSEAQSNISPGTVTHEPPRTQTITQDQGRRHSSVPLTEASLATLGEQLRRTAPHGHRRNRQPLSSMSKVMPLLDRNLAGSAADKAVFQHPVRGTHRSSIESVQDRPLLERGSSYNGDSCCMSNTAPFEPPILGLGSSDNASHKPGSTLGKASSANGSAVNSLSILPKTGPLWLRGFSNFSSGVNNPATKEAIIQATANSEPGRCISQARTNLTNPSASQGRSRLSIGNARGLVLKSSKWIKRGTKGLRNLATLTPSVTSPFFRREDMGAPRCPSPTMEESESYEVYQRFRPDDRLRTNRHTIAMCGSDYDRDVSSAMRSAAIREHLFGSATPEAAPITSSPFHGPFTPVYASPNITIVETGLGGSRMAPSSGRRTMRR